MSKETTEGTEGTVKRTGEKHQVEIPMGMELVVLTRPLKVNLKKMV